MAKSQFLTTSADREERSCAIIKVTFPPRQPRVHQGSLELSASAYVRVCVRVAWRLMHEVFDSIRLRNSWLQRRVRRRSCPASHSGQGRELPGSGCRELCPANRRRSLSCARSMRAWYEEPAGGRASSQRGYRRIEAWRSEMQGL